MATKNRQFIETLSVCGRFDYRDYLSHRLNVIFESELDLVKLLKLCLELYNGRELIVVLSHLLYCFRANGIELGAQKVLVDKIYNRLKSLEDILNEHDLGNMGFKLLDKVASEKCGIFKDEKEMDDYLKEHLVIDITSNMIFWIQEVMYNIQKENLMNFKHCLSICDTNKQEIASIRDDIVLVLVYEDRLETYNRKSIDKLDLSSKDYLVILTVER